jgi:hypothetical protein
MALLHVLLAPFAAVCGYILVGFLAMLPELLRRGNPQHARPLADLWVAMAWLEYIPLLIFIPLSFAAGLGLWKQRRWGRRLAFGLASIGALTVINGMFWELRQVRAQIRGRHPLWPPPPYPEIVVALGALLLLWYGWVFWYLSRRDVAEAFHGRVAPTAADATGAR